jgi:hypothetical protein
MNSRSLEYDEIDVVSLTMEDLVQNIKARAENFKPATSELLRQQTKVDYTHVRWLDNNTLIILKERNLIGVNRDFYERAAGEIRVTFENKKDKTILKAKIDIDIAFITLSHFFLGGMAMVFSVLFFESWPAKAVSFVALQLVAWGIAAFARREYHIALTHYYKTYLFNIINP